MEPVVSESGPFAGKIVIDPTNPVTRTEHGPDLALAFTDSAAEALAQLVPQARVVKTLNQVGAEIMVDTSGFAHPPAMFMAGDDEDAKRVVSTLLADFGFEPLDAGASASGPAARAARDGLDQSGLAARPRPQLGLRSPSSTKA